MTCTKAQSMITPFINNKLNLKEIEDFLDHIGSCPICREELEVYYALLTAMKQLDEDKNLSDDFGLELSQKIERAQERILHIKYTYYRKKAILIISMILLAFLMSFRYAYKSEEQVNNVTESNFRIRNSFRNEKNDYLETQLQNYLKKQNEKTE
ncbi:MAG: anti-sigma factor family protein [Mobilitalea sp.]